MIKIHDKLSKRRGAVAPSPIIETRPCCLVGAAAFLKQEYIEERRMGSHQSLVLFDHITGEIDKAASFNSRSGPREARSRSRKALEKNRLRRKKYYESRDKRKKAKIAIAAQQLTMTKIWG